MIDVAQINREAAILEARLQTISRRWYKQSDGNHYLVYIGSLHIKTLGLTNVYRWKRILARKAGVNTNSVKYKIIESVRKSLPDRRNLEYQKS